MSRALPWFVTILLLAAPAAAQVPPRDTSAPAETATIRGRVTRADTGQPLARADVRAASSTLTTPRAVKTGADGRYEIGGLPPGRYVVSAVKTNYVTAAFGQKRPLGPGARFDLATRQVAENIDFALLRAGVIAGRVLDGDGDPIADVQVRAMRYQYANGERRLGGAPGGFAMTNDLGDFRMFGLPPGDYYVAAALPIFSDGPMGQGSGYAPTYYPGTGNVSDAQRISIAAGQFVSGVTMALLPVRTVQVSGTVFDASGQPLKGGFVSVMARIGTMGLGGNSAPISQDGRFTIKGLAPGEYVLRGASPGLGSGTIVVPVTVGDGDITDLQLVSQPPATMTGRVLFDGDGPRPAPASIRIMAQRADPMLNAGTPPDGGVRSDFSFDIKVAPGRALIRATQPLPAWRFKRVIINGRDVTDTGVDIPANGALSNVVVEFTNKLNEVSATVIDSAGASRDVWVILFAQDPRKWTPLSRYVAAARADGDGRVRIRLMAGEYYAIAVEDAEPGEWTDAEYLARIHGNAIAFSIADGETKSLELRTSASR